MIGMLWGRRSARLVVAVAATLLGFALLLLEQLNFHVVAWLTALVRIVAGIPAILAFGILSWPVVLTLSAVVVVALAIYAVPFRFTRLEAALWLAYALVLGPALGGAWSLYAASIPAPPGSRKVCYAAPSHAPGIGTTCLYETTSTPQPMPRSIESARAVPAAAAREFERTPFPMLAHPTPLR